MVLCSTPSWLDGARVGSDARRNRLLVDRKRVTPNMTMVNEPDWNVTHPEAVTHFKNLLRLDTTNPPGNERAAADYLAAVLAREGIPSKLLEPAPGRANLIARLTGSGK